MTKTSHARRRQAQRNISDEAIELAQLWGDEEFQRDGHVSYFVSRNAVERAGLEGVDLSEHVGVFVVVGADGAIVTTMRGDETKRSKRARRDQKWRDKRTKREWGNRRKGGTA